MPETRTCPRCRRAIDSAARMCPYCNFDLVLGKVDTPPRLAAVDPSAPLPAPAPVPPVRARASAWWSTRILVVAAVAALLITTFAVGALVRGLHSGGERQLSQAQQQARKNALRPAAAEPSAADLNLAPVEDSTQTIGRSITSAPIPDPDHKVPPEYQRNDATALPADQYSRILQQATPTTSQPISVDPRSIVNQAPATLPEDLRRRQEEQKAREQRAQDAARARQAMQVESARTVPPVPISQPIPEMRRLEQDVTVRYSLLVGTDGRVKEVNILEGNPDVTAKMIGAIQRWKFKPATRNGEPVEGTFTVDISFKAE